jgi:hypothetical protein
VQAIFSVTTFMMGLLSAGALCLDLLSRSAIGRAVPDGLFLGVLGFVLCAYVLFVWRYVAGRLPTDASGRHQPGLMWAMKK